MRSSSFKAKQKIGLWPVLTGIVVWSAIAYGVIFVVLDPARFGDTERQLAVPIEPVQRQTGEAAIEIGVAAKDKETEAHSTDSDSGSATQLAESWIDDTALTNGWYVQVGSYKSKIEAEVERLKFARLQVPVHTKVSDDELTHLFIGPYQNESEARQISEQVAAELNVARVAIREITTGQAVVSVEESVEEQLPQTQAAPEVELASQLEEVPAAQAKPENEPVAEVNVEPEVESEVVVQMASQSQSESPSEPEEQPSAQTQPTPEIQPAPQPQAASQAEPKVEIAATTGNWYIQVGAFKQIENARTLSAKIRSNNLPLKIERSESDYIRILIGPYPTRENAATSLPEVSEALSLDNAVVRQTEG